MTLSQQIRAIIIESECTWTDAVVLFGSMVVIALCLPLLAAVGG